MASNTNYFAMQDDYNEFEMWQGLRGPFFQPHVASDGTLSWTNNGGLTNPDPIRIEGHDGAPGFSPTVEIQQIQGGHRVIITDEDGPHSFDVIDYMEGRAIQSTILNADYTLTIRYTDGTSYTTPSIRGATGATGAPGAAGADGVSPDVTITAITGGHRVTITDADHPQGQSFDVMDGSGGSVSSVNNVQPDGGGNVAISATNVPASIGTVQSNLESLQTAVNGKQGTITASGILKGNGSGGVSAATKGTDYGALAFTVTLTAARWSSNAQTVSNANFLASGYGYIVSPASGSFADYASAQIYADDVTVAGQMTFHCTDAPSTALTVNIARVVSA